MITSEQKTVLINSFKDRLFLHQKTWYLAGNTHRIRNILKSRHIGATWYFACEALCDALETGRNQIFLSDSEEQVHIFKLYIQRFVMDVIGVDLQGDPIVLPNGATLYFLDTDSQTEHNYHGNVYMNEYFWIPCFKEYRKVASAMAMHKNSRLTFFSTPSLVNHEAYRFWTGEIASRNRAKEDPFTIDVSHTALKNGRRCEDGQWRQIVTVLDAIAGGCDHFDLEQLRFDYGPDAFNNLLMCQFVDNAHENPINQGLMEVFE